MNVFPRLKTGAVAQYPAKRTVAYSTQVLRFLDGSEQRFREQSGALRCWRVRLDLLVQDELRTLEDFFRSMQGAAGRFSFEDPWDGTIYPHCSFDVDEFAGTLEGEARGGTWVVIREERED